MDFFLLRLSEEEREVLMALVEDGIDVQRALIEDVLKDCELTDGTVDPVEGFNRFLEVCSDEEMKQVLLERLRAKLGGTDDGSEREASAGGV